MHPACITTWLPFTYCRCASRLCHKQNLNFFVQEHEIYELASFAWHRSRRLPACLGQVPFGFVALALLEHDIGVSQLLSVLLQAEAVF